MPPPINRIKSSALINHCHLGCLPLVGVVSVTGVFSEVTGVVVRTCSLVASEVIGSGVGSDVVGSEVVDSGAVGSDPAVS